MNNSNIESEIKLKVNMNEANIIVAALRELPHRIVADLITNVMDQVKRQIPTAYQSPTIVNN